MQGGGHLMRQVNGTETQRNEGGSGEAGSERGARALALATFSQVQRYVAGIINKFFQPSVSLGKPWRPSGPH